MNRFVEFINSASESLAHELISPHAVFYVPGRPEPLRGPAGYLSSVGMMRSGFPNTQWSLEDMITEGDAIAASFLMRGTHYGAFMGIAPTGEPVEVQAMNFYRLTDGQFTEEYGQPDMLGLLQKTGAAPAASLTSGCLCLACQLVNTPGKGDEITSEHGLLNPLRPVCG